MIVECQYCGEEFKTTSYRVSVGRGKFCSRECSDKARRRKITRKCEICGSEFKIKPSELKKRNSAGRFCSKKCMGIAFSGKQNPNYKGGDLISFCRECGAEIHTPRRGQPIKQFCSYSCYDSYKKGENNPNWRGGISFEPYCPKFNEELKEYVRSLYGRKCVICAKTEKENKRKLGVHHIDYNKQQGCDSSFMLLPLCSTCHPKTNFNRDHWIEVCTLIYEERRSYNNEIGPI